MLPFWNFFENDNSVKIEDPEKGITLEAREKSFSGKVNGMNIQASFKSFSVQGNSEMPNNLLGFFNPFAFFMKPSSSQPITNRSENKKELKQE